MKIIQIGNGNVAKMHRQCFPERVETVAIVDISPQQQEKMKEAGSPVFQDIDSVPRELTKEADIWDICVPDEEHIPVMKRLLERG